MGSTTLVWISGATYGIGAGLARTCPYPGAEIVNLSRSAHPDLPTVRLDLTERSTWYDVGRDFTERLARFDGERVVFVHNAFHYVDRDYAGEGQPGAHEAEAVANCVAPLVLGDLFLHAAMPAVEAGVDVGLVMMSSAAADLGIPGLTTYCAAKAAVEQWVIAVRTERADRGRGPWVVAVRPGFVDTPAARRDATQDPASYPDARNVAQALVSRAGIVDEDTMAGRIWASVPPADDVAVIDLG